MFFAFQTVIMQKFLKIAYKTFKQSESFSHGLFVFKKSSYIFLKKSLGQA